MLMWRVWRAAITIHDDKVRMPRTVVAAMSTCEAYVNQYSNTPHVYDVHSVERGGAKHTSQMAARALCQRGACGASSIAHVAHVGRGLMNIRYDKYTAYCGGSNGHL